MSNTFDSCLFKQDAKRPVPLNQPGKFILEGSTPTNYANTEIFSEYTRRRFPEDDGELFTQVFESDE